MTLDAGADVDIDDILDAVGRKGCKLRTASQAVANITQADIGWVTEDEDTDGFHGSSGASAVTIPAGLGGLYAVTYGVLFNALTVGTRTYGSINFVSSVTGGHLDQYRDRTDASDDRMVVSVTLPLLAGDSFTCNAFHTQGASLNITAHLSCYRVGL